MQHFPRHCLDRQKSRWDANGMPVFSTKAEIAQLALMTELRLQYCFVELGTPLCTGPADLAEVRAEVEAIRAWFDHAPDEGWL